MDFEKEAQDLYYQLECIECETLDDQVSSQLDCLKDALRKAFEAGRESMVPKVIEAAERKKVAKKNAKILAERAHADKLADTLEELKEEFEKCPEDYPWSLTRIGYALKAHTERRKETT
jgi:hypothetical protein